MKKFKWKRGQKARLCFLVGLLPQHLNDILSRKRGVSKERAIELEVASLLVLKRKIPWSAWLFNKTSKNPIFTTEVNK